MTTSGMCSAEPLNCTIAALGLERVMFGADHPFETAQEAGEFLDHVSIADAAREDVASNNAIRLFESAKSMTKVLIVDVHAEMYGDALRRNFPRCNSLCFTAARRWPGDLSDVDVMIMFGIELRDHMLAGAPRSEMDSVAGDRGRSFPALPVAQTRGSRSPAAAASTARRCASRSSI